MDREKVKIIRDKLRLLNDNLIMYKSQDIDIVKNLQDVNQFIANQSFNHNGFMELSQNNLGVSLQNPYAIIPKTKV